MSDENVRVSLALWISTQPRARAAGMRTCPIGASGRPGRALYHSAEPGRATAIRYATGKLAILDHDDAVAAVTIAPEDRGRVGAARVSIHLGATRLQLALTYVQLEPIVAGRLASEIEAA